MICISIIQNNNKTISFVSDNMNCSSLAIETPKKVFIRNKEQTPIKLDLDPSKRFSPSKTVKTLLDQVNRVHEFQFHLELQFVDLTQINLTQNLVREISNFIFDENPDLSDLILKFEEVSVSEGHFGDFMKGFISEEFSVDPEYSVLIICVLNYMQSYSLGVSESFAELLNFPSSETMCQLCIAGDNFEDKLKLAQIHNLSIYRTLASRVASGVDTDLEDISNASDDSINDKPFVLERLTCSDIYSDQSSVTKDGSMGKFNPYDTSGSENSFFDGLQTNGHIMNSTEMFNPYSETDSEDFNKLMNSTRKEMNSTRKGLNSSRKEFQCELCEKKFSNSYNRKLHNISVHRFFPKGMPIYHCDHPNCKFVTGSNILFNRHVPTHVKENLVFDFTFSLKN